MQKSLDKESQEAFVQYFLHTLTFGNNTWFDYFKLNPIRWIIYVLLTSLICKIQLYAIKKKSINYLLIVKKVLLKNINYINTTNLIIRRMFDLKMYIKELYLWFLVFKKLNRRKK